MAISPDFLKGYEAGTDPDRLEFFSQVIAYPLDLPYEDDPSGVTRVYSQVFEEGANQFGLGAIARAEYEKSEDPAQYNLKAKPNVTVTEFDASFDGADIILANWMRGRGIARWKTLLE